MKLRHLLLPSGILLTLLTVHLAYRLTAPKPAHGSAPSEEGDSVTVKRGNFEVLCREEGELKPVQVTALSFLRWGKISFLLPEGTNVKKGDKVVGLDTQDLQEEIQQIQVDLSAAQVNLAQQEQFRDLEIKRLNTDVLSEKDSVDLVKLKETDILAKPIKEEKEEAENTLNVANAHVNATRADLESFKPLVEKGFGQRSDYNTKQLAVALALVEQERAQMKRRITLAGALPWEREKAKLDRQSAELAFRLKQIDFEDQSDSLTVKVRSAERAVAQLQKKLNSRKIDFDHSMLTAPHEGIVVYRTLDFKGIRKVEIGEWAGPWMSPIELPNYEKMKVRAQVPESFVSRLSARPNSQNGEASGSGTPARVMVKTLPNLVYDAEVTWIDNWAHDRNSKLSEADGKIQGLSGVRVFDVEAELKISDMEHLREGFRAVVEFPVETVKDVISIPVGAVTTQDGATYVKIIKDGATERRKVDLGEHSAERVIVIGGLLEGERIFVPRAAPVAQKAEEKKPKAEKSRARKRPQDGGMEGGH